MTIRLESYVPLLKWRMGEYQALSRLSDDAKNRITPLLVIPPIEFDFEEQRPKKNIQEHIETFVPRYVSKWGGRNALIDVHESIEDEFMDDGRHIISYIFSEIREKDAIATPVVSFSKSDLYKQEVRDVIVAEGRGLCLRVRLSEVMHLSFNGKVRDLCSYMKLDVDELDLILDLEEPENFIPYSGFSKVITSGVKKIDRIGEFRSFIVAGMSLNLSEIRKPGGEVPRHEWHLYHHLVGDLSDFRQPTYSDYTIETPKFMSMDMRMINPAGKIVYTCDDTWLIAKGGSFRADTAQMIDHCNAIVTSGVYAGPTFSFGDGRINATLTGAEGTGNLGTWKQVGVSHHLEKVVVQLASFHGT